MSCFSSRRSRRHSHIIAPDFRSDGPSDVSISDGTHQNAVAVADPRMNPSTSFGEGEKGQLEQSRRDRQSHDRHYYEANSSVEGISVKANESCIQTVHQTVHTHVRAWQSDVGRDVDDDYEQEQQTSRHAATEDYRFQHVVNSSQSVQEPFLQLQRSPSQTSSDDDVSIHLNADDDDDLLSFEAVSEPTLQYVSGTLDDHIEEKEEVMGYLTMARFNIETLRRQQSAMLRQRKSNHQTLQQEAKFVMRQAILSDRARRRENERQVGLIKARVAEQRQRRAKQLIGPS